MRSAGQPEMGPHTEAETTLGTTSFLAICTKTKLTTGAFCLFYKPGLCVVLAAKYAQLRMLPVFLMSLTELRPTSDGDQAGSGWVAVVFRGT